MGGGGGITSEFDGIAAVETFKELGERVGVVRPQKEDVIVKMLSEAGLLESRMKEVHEQVGVGRDHLYVHTSRILV